MKKETLFNQTDAALLLGISRTTLVKWIRQGKVREAQTKPSRIAHKELVRLGAKIDESVLAAKSPALKNGKPDDSLFKADLSKLPADAINAVKKRADTLKVIEQVKKARLDNGEHVKLSAVHDDMRRFGNLVRAKVEAIPQGAPVEVHGKTPREIEKIISDRCQNCLRELAGDEWMSMEVV